MLSHPKAGASSGARSRSWGFPYTRLPSLYSSMQGVAATASVAARCASAAACSGSSMQLRHLRPAARPHPPAQQLWVPARGRGLYRLHSAAARKPEARTKSEERTHKKAADAHHQLELLKQEREAAQQLRAELEARYAGRQGRRGAWGKAGGWGWGWVGGWAGRACGGNGRGNIGEGREGQGREGEGDSTIMRFAGAGAALLLRVGCRASPLWHSS